MAGDLLMDRASHLWAQLAAVPVSFPSEGGRQIVASPDSNLCPPSWTGIVELGDAAIITAPDEVQARHLRKLLAAAPVDSLVFVVHDGSDVLAAAGYRTWPASTAHLSVLTATRWRGRGLAQRVASEAVAHALAAGLLPQWRARPAASRRLAESLGFRELGGQLSVRLDV